MEKLLTKTCEALEALDKSGNTNIMDNADRRLIAELVDIKKNILKVMKLEEELDGGTSRGAYRDGGSWSGGHSRRSYSARSEMLGHLESACSAAPDEESRRMARDLMDRIGRS